MAVMIVIMALVIAHMLQSALMWRKWNQLKNSHSLPQVDTSASDTIESTPRDHSGEAKSKEQPEQQPSELLYTEENSCSGQGRTHGAKTACGKTTHRDNTSQKKSDPEAPGIPPSGLSATSSLDLHHAEYPDYGTEADYTDGPATVRKLHDGAKSSGALLLKLDLVKMIARAIHSLRSYYKEKSWARRQTAEIEIFERNIRSEIADKARRIAENNQHQEDLDATAIERLESWQNELKILKQVLAGLQADKRAIKDTVKSCSERLLRLSELVIDYLEMILVDCWMIGPEDNEEKPVTRYDTSIEYQKAAKYLGPPASKRSTTPVPVEDSRRQSLSLDERYEIFTSHQEAIRLYILTQANLADVLKKREKEWQNCCQARNDGELSVSSEEDFDNRWAQIVQSATERMNDSKEALKKVEGAATLAGVTR